MSDVNYNTRNPDSSFNTEYPYNQATITRSGHEFYINDAPGMESLRLAHTKGTYIEINETGKFNQVVVDKAYFYYKDGVTETADGHKDVIIAGALKTTVENSMEEIVSGNRYSTIGGDGVLTVAQSYQETILNDHGEVVGGKRTSRIEGSLESSILGDRVETVEGVKVDGLSQDWFTKAGGGIEMQADGTVRFKCKRFVVDAEEIVLTTSAGNIIITAAGIVNASGQQIRLND
jgi:hypothetical protein